MSEDATTEDATTEEEVLERARAAGEAHAREQIDGDHFKDWVWEQVVEAEEMRAADPDSVVPLESKSDARRVAKNMLQQLQWDTDRQLDLRDLLSLVGDTEGVRDQAVAKSFFSGFRAVLQEREVVDWLADEVLERHEELGQESMVREAPAGQPMSADAFASLLTSLVPADRRTSVSVQPSIGGSRHGASVYVNFVNLPLEKGERGAESENNRASFWVRGFPHDRTAPTEKVKVEQSNNVFNRRVPFRAKTGSPDAVARYLAAYLAKVVETVPPNFTHTRVSESRRNDSRGLDREKRDLLDVLPALAESRDRRWRYVVVPVTVHAGGRREPGRGEEVVIDHADVALQPHQILDQHGIPHYRWDYTDPGGRWIEVPERDFVDALKALRSYGRVDPRTWAEKRGRRA